MNFSAHLKMTVPFLILPSHRSFYWVFQFRLVGFGLKLNFGRTSVKCATEGGQARVTVSEGKWVDMGKRPEVTEPPWRRRRVGK